MFKITGIDGKEYGPISSDQLRQWIAEGRANGATKVLPEGATEWKPLSQLPEFADALAGRVQLPPPPPPPGPANAELLASDILARDYQLDIGSCISRSWGVLAQNFWLLVGACFVATLLANIPFCGGVAMAGIFYLWLRLIRGRPAEFGDIFAGFSQAFLQLFLATLAVAVLVAAGCLCLVLPGIYLAVAWLFAFPLILDKKMDFWPAMELSRKVVTRHWWVIFGLLFLCYLLELAGSLCCVIGVFVATPLAFGAITFAYEDIFNPRTHV